MSSHSPQRPRKSQAHQTQGSMHNIVPPRETSPSPSFNQRPRNMKTNSLPSVLQLFDNANRQSPQQHSPTSTSRRSPPLPVGQIQRGLPTPPHPNVAIPAVQAQDRRVNSPSPPHVTHYPRPVNRHLSSQFLASFQGVDENLHMTDELLADIERADMQKMQGLGHPASSYHLPSGKDDTSVSPKDHVVERIRNTGKSSPKDPDGRRQHRPQSRDKQPSSPTTQAISHTPERRSSPNYHSPLASSGDSSSTYVSRSQRSPLSLALPSHSPPTLTTVRTPDKSLPVQEEPEDETLHMRSESEWMGHENEPDRRVSPAPSSDLHPEGNARRSYRDETIRGLPNGRNSRAGHRKEDDDTLVEQSITMASNRDDEGGHTPRSPTAGLPDIPQERYQQHRSAVPAASSRGRNRTAATDQLGLRGFDPVLLEQGHTQERDEPPQYVESHGKPSTQRSAADMRSSNNHARYYTPQILPDDFMHDPTSAYLHALMGASPRPDAPIPPTPHSQTTPPSPSQASYDPRHELPPFSPVAPVGSPYPYPFTHVRRNRPSSYQGPQQGNEGYENMDLNHPSIISEQMKRQYQIYAQNNLGHISDSTFSPASTPYPAHANYFNQWANWHTHKLLGVGPMGNIIRDPMSIRSSPSHEPISLPAPPTVGLRKKDTRTNLRRASSMGARKLPPRVDSTQPRETSPEPSSSGESTAGEGQTHQQHFALPEEGSWVNGSLPPLLTRDDDLGDWIDEDEEEDDEDLLELEFHPSYVNNVEKRRRRFETKWEALLQAFQALDRQTDATLVLMAAPSHSSKLHLVTSRSIRRQPNHARAPLLTGLRLGFRQMAVQRRSARSLKSSLADRLLTPQSNSPGDGSVGSAEAREEELKRALGAALGSLDALGRIHEQREARWKEEMSRISEDRERIELLLRQALGDRDPQTL